MDTSHSVWHHMIWSFSKTEQNFFSRETSFHQLSNIASPCLKKMLILIILYTHESVSPHERCYHLKPPGGPQGPRSYVEKSGIIYRYKCDRVDCDEEYIGESSRTFWERFKEHQKAPSSIYDHYNITGHKISIDNFSLVGREDQNLMRTIKKAPCIRVNNPSLNRNIGKYHLPHIWDEVLLNTSELKIT